MRINLRNNFKYCIWRRWNCFKLCFQWWEVCSSLQIEFWVKNIWRWKVDRKKAIG